MSTTIEIGGDGGGDGDGNGDGDESEVHKGLLTLVLSLVEILDDALEQEAVRRMESGDLTDEEIERLGAQLKQLDAEITRLKREEGVDEHVDEFRGELDGLLEDAIRRLGEPTATSGVTHE